MVMGWVRDVFIWAALLCVHGSRTKCRSLGICDGASLTINAVA